MDWVKQGHKLGFEWPYTEADVIEQTEIEEQIKIEKDFRDRNAPKVVEFKTGRDFLNYCDKYNKGGE